MTRKTLAEELGLKKAPGKVPPAFLPKLRIRVGSDRTRQVAEFLVDIPLEGYSGEAWDKAVAQLHAVFEKFGLLKTRPKLEGIVNGQEKETGAAEGLEEQAESGAAESSQAAG